MRIAIVVAAVVVFGGVVGLLIWARAQPVRVRPEPVPAAEPPAPPRIPEDVQEETAPPVIEEEQPPAPPETGTVTEPAAPAEPVPEPEPREEVPAEPEPEPREEVPAEPEPEPREEVPAGPEPEPAGPAEPAAPAAAEPAAYVGAAVCATCHGAEDHKWKQLRHAAAWSRLRLEFREPSAKDEIGRACISCHVTGYGQAGRKGFVDPSRSAHLLGVQCEACHGPGSAHVEAAERAAASGAKPGAITRKPTNCTSCHNPHVSYAEFK